MIEIITEYGFCTGVKHALSVFEEAKSSSKELILLKPLMHNEKENEKLLTEKVSFLGENISANASLLFPAHGHDIQDEIRFQHHKTYDALCPVIQARYRLLEKHKNECKWFYVGKAGHQETIGFLSHFPFLTFVDEKIISDLRDKKELQTGLIVQSTFELKRAAEMVNFFKTNTDLHFVANLCPLYLNRANTAIQVLTEVDPFKSCFIVLGSKTSSNCNELYNLIKEKCPLLKGIIANDVKDISLDVVKGKDIYLVSSTSISKENVWMIKKQLELMLS